MPSPFHIKNPDDLVRTAKLFHACLQEAQQAKDVCRNQADRSRFDVEINLLLLLRRELCGDFRIET